MAPGGCHLGQDVSVPDPTHGNIELIPMILPVSIHAMSTRPVMSGIQNE